MKMGGVEMVIHVPASIEEAQKQLGGIGLLLTAKQWERAAIVYAFTEPGTGGPRTGANMHQLSLREFADLGIAGLTDHRTVAAYRKAWQSAVDLGMAPAVAPTSVADVPNLPWKDHFGEPTADVQERVFRQVVKDPERFRAALREQPDVAQELAQRVVDTPSVRVAVEARQTEIVARSERVTTLPREDFRGDLVAAAGLVTRVVRAIQRGEFVPSATEAMLLHSLGLAISQASPEQEPDNDLFAEIERHLAEARV